MVSSSSTSASDPSTSPPIYFWREYKPHGHLSQWYLSPFTVPSTGLTFQTAEQYMMHSKAVLFSDQDIASQILSTPVPTFQKQLGRKVSNFDQKIWEQNRERIVEEGNYWKFKNGQDEGELREEGKGIREWLTETGERELVEASPFDRIWGIGFGEGKAEKARTRWGWNLLGKALMRVRERLREEGEGGREKEDGVQA